MTKKSKRIITRYGIGELFGLDFTRLSPSDIQKLSSTKNRTRQCPFKSGDVKCNKQGGVCSLRLFLKEGENVSVCKDTSLVTTCPERFNDSGEAVRWAGEYLLGTESPLVLKELPFLKAVGSEEETAATVGKIDMVLVHPDTSHLKWCALEIQAVYFSGASMSKDFAVMKGWSGPGLPFPQGQRRPDFRSSGPKRLMPQLQIKVPTISRWGKKMAVVVDLPFWESLGPIEEVEHASNCDIAWFVMKYIHDGERFCMKPHKVHLTTLDRAVEGLTGGYPTSLSDFEDTLLSKINDFTG